MAEAGQVEVLDNIPVELDTAAVVKQMKLHGDTKRYEKIINELLEIALPIARPKAVYKVSCIEKKDQDSLEIDGIKFTGKLVRDTLDKVETVFPTVVTSGRELEDIPIPAGDVMRKICLDSIRNQVLFAASNYVRAHLTKCYSLGELSALNPGELEAFPSAQHRLIFALLGDVEGMIGVRLSENCALLPTKSGSSLLFSSDSKFVSCRLCKQFRCTGRRAPFDAELAKQYTGPKIQVTR
jgi:hypothetical protein